MKDKSETNRWNQQNSERTECHCHCHQYHYIRVQNCQAWHHNIKLSWFGLWSFRHFGLIKCLKGMKSQRSLFVSKFLSEWVSVTNRPREGRQRAAIPGQLKNVPLPLMLRIPPPFPSPLTHWPTFVSRKFPQVQAKVRRPNPEVRALSRAPCAQSRPVLQWFLISQTQFTSKHRPVRSNQPPARLNIFFDSLYMSHWFWEDTERKCKDICE